MRLTKSRLAAAMLLPALSSPPVFAAEQPTLQEQIAITATIKAPIGALMTYQMINSCVRVRRAEPMTTYDEGKQYLRAMTADEQAAAIAHCAGLTEELASARMDFLDRALRGEVDGAAGAFLNAGPNGDPALLKDKPNDPQVVDWKRQAVGYLTAAALRGDLSSIVYLHIQKADPAQLGAPLPMIYAADAAVARIMQQAAMDDVFSEAARQLTPDELAQARTLADDMVAAVARRREAPPAAAAN